MDPRGGMTTIAVSTPIRSSLGVCSTPKDKDKNTYRYFCPICMWYYKRILKTHCCGGQYVCELCLRKWYRDSKNYMELNGVERESLLKTLVDSPTAGDGSPTVAVVALKVRCPYCNGELRASRVNNHECVRSYCDSPSTSAAKSRVDVRHFNTATPPRVGDSFDELRRKCIRLNSVLSPTQTATSQCVTPTRRRILPAVSAPTPPRYPSITSPRRLVPIQPASSVPPQNPIGQITTGSSNSNSNSNSSNSSRTQSTLNQRTNPSANGGQRSRSSPTALSNRVETITVPAREVDPTVPPTNPLRRTVQPPLVTTPAAPGAPLPLVSTPTSTASQRDRQLAAQAAATGRSGGPQRSATRDVLLNDTQSTQSPPPTTTTDVRPPPPQPPPQLAPVEAIETSSALCTTCGSDGARCTIM